MCQPNIILFVSDQHRSDWMGAAGNPFVKTPNMDMMAKEGVNFSNTYCNSPLCVPSRMSKVTGDAADLSWDQRSVFSELTQFNDVSRMMVKGRYKLVYHHSFPKAQLFDLVSDPQEQNNLGDNANYQHVKDEMIVELMKGWDPEEVKNNHKRKTENNTYLGKWGKVSGWGRHELWNPGDSSPR